VTRSRTLGKLIASTAACILLGAHAAVPIAGASEPAAAVSLDPTLKIHPLLQYGALADPNRVVHVIVQKVKPDSKASALVAQVPGLQVEEEFQVVPAFVARVPASALSSLAAQSDVRYISPDGAIQVIPAVSARATGKPAKNQSLKSARAPKRKVSARNLLTTHPIDIGAAAAWGSDKNGVTGNAISVAVIDSGVDAAHADLRDQVIAVNVNKNSSTTSDGYGHGTHVAGIINGHDAAQHYLGVAPNATLISVKIADDSGQAYESDLLRGLDWVKSNRDTYQIRALNLSVSTSVPESYATSPVDAAVERLWSEGVAVVAAAGNLGSAEDAVWYAPANDPYVITVGCLDDNGTTLAGDDSLCPISSRGITEDGFAKPDLIAPGRKIVSALAEGPGGLSVALADYFPNRITPDGHHIRLSGTSMAAPMVVGAIALLLERQRNLTPDQLKDILVRSSSRYPGQVDNAGRLDISAALLSVDQSKKDVTQVPLPVGAPTAPRDSTTLVWDGARWGSTYWDGARWGSAYWDGARWGNATWDGARWGNATWDGARWGSAYWDGARWGSAFWDGARWGSAFWDGARWGSAAWDAGLFLD
jgi:serine protease AprX